MRSNNGENYNCGIKITNMASCHFDKLNKVSNEDLLVTGGRKIDPRLLQFVEKRMGVHNRYHSPKNVNSLDLAREALADLLKLDPSLKTEAEFLIFAGISNPLPTVCMSAFLSAEFELENVSCWDIKSGCSSGVLVFIQALDWFSTGGKKGIIICLETLSKFTNPEFLQMSLSSGDGAVALTVERSLDWQVIGVVHGTDPRTFKSLYVPGQYPVDINNYNPSDYVFKVDEKSDAIDRLEHYWNKSLQDLLLTSKAPPEKIKHYISHQVDATKNKEYARKAGIPASSVASNIQEYGNMGCPTVYLNYQQWMNDKSFEKDDILVLHAVGGGISWAAIALKKL